MVALRVMDLVYRYPDGTEALRGATFTVDEGRRVAILGPNGSGKTTLLRCLNGLLMPSEGRVEVLGRPVERGTLEEVRRWLQLVFQNPDDQLFAPSVEEDVSFGPRNLGLGQEEIAERVTGALASLGIQQLAGRNPSQLSQGQKRLAAIAGVVSMRPAIVALDEPAADLDERSSRAILRILDAFHGEGKTILMTTHDVELACAWADEIIILADGRVVAQGPPAEVFYGPIDLEGLGVRLPAAVHLFKELSHLGLVNPNARPVSVKDLLAALPLAVERP